MKTLVLNNSEIPLSIIESTDAVEKVYRGVAIIVKQYDEIFYTNIHDIDAYDYKRYGGLGGFFDEELIKNQTKVQVALKTPAVIQLISYDQSPHDVKGIPLSRKNIFMRDQYQCQYKGCATTKRAVKVYGSPRLPVDILTWDHVHPKSRGGPNKWENLTTCCQKCNNYKDNRTPDEAGMVLLSKPFKPDTLPLQFDSPKTPDEWRDWLYWNVSLDTDNA